MNNHLQKIGIWVINLPDNTERMQRMQTQLQRMGLVWQHFPAVDGRKEYARLLPQADEQAYARNMGSPLLPGKLGVFASHTSVWRQFLDSDHELALIFEDDVVFHDDFLEVLHAACDERRKHGLHLPPARPDVRKFHSEIPCGKSPHAA